MITKNQIQFVKSLQQKKYRNEFSLFVVEGEKMVTEVLNSSFNVDQIYVVHEFSHAFPEETVLRVSKKDMERMSGLKNASPVLAVVHQNQLKEENTEGIILLLDGVRDPGNLGSIIRSADWFGVSSILCAEDTVECYNSKVVQASMGSIFRVPISYLPLKGKMEELKASGKLIFGTCLGGEPLKMDKEANQAWVIGSESHGISEEIQSLCDACYEIPKFGKAESLNASVAAGIILSQLRL